MRLCQEHESGGVLQCENYYCLISEQLKKPAKQIYRLSRKIKIKWWKGKKKKSDLLHCSLKWSNCLFIGPWQSFVPRNSCSNHWTSFKLIKLNLQLASCHVSIDQEQIPIDCKLIAEPLFTINENKNVYLRYHEIKRTKIFPLRGYIRSPIKADCTIRTNQWTLFG